MNHPFARNLRQHARAIAFGCALALAAVGAARAQDATDAPVLDAQTRQWLDEAVARAQDVASVPLRMEVSVGALDSRLRLAPCNRVEPHLPVGTRLWGRSRIGLRCVDGPVRWNVFLPVTIKAYGPVWALRDNVLPGQTLTEADAVQTEADWAADNSPVVTDVAQWVGLAASRALPAGQTLRQSMPKPPQLFAAGTQVRVIAQGPGFQIAAEGQALTAGLLGQMVRIRMDNGRMTSGTVIDARTVQLDM
jgi:flagella basal body P-ring formation protein FlgA